MNNKQGMTCLFGEMSKMERHVITQLICTRAS